MSHKRLRVCLKSTLLFVIATGLSAAFAQPRPTRPDSIVVFAPHPDDEVIGCAGIIMQALARGVRVKVVAITSGDGFPAAAAGVAHKAVDQLGPDDFFALSRFRQMQSRTALGILGGKADDLIVLGYPDGDLGNLYDSTDDKVIRQQFTKKNETYASIQKDYHTSVHGKPAAYQRSSVLADLVELLTTLQPTEIYVTDETDGHIDHRVAFWFVRDAAKQAGYKGAFYTYLVHGLPAWPFPAGVTPNLPFESRTVDGEVVPRGLPWPPPRRIPLTPEQAQRKLKSIQAHNIPVLGMPEHQSEMESFVKSEEVFWTPLASLITIKSFPGDETPDLSSLSDADLKTVTVHFERMGCYGTCPAYTVTIHGDGRIEYLGKEYVKQKGAREGRVEVTIIRTLLSEFARAKFLSLPEEYSEEKCPGRRCTDMATAITELVVRGVTHRVKHYYGCGGVPKALFDLESAIDKSVNAQQWTGDVSKQGPFGTTCF